MKIAVLIALTLLCAAAAGHLLLRSQADTPAATRGPATADAGRGGGAKLEALAAAIDTEAGERRRLERKVDALRAELDALRGAPAGPAPETAVVEPDFEPAVAESTGLAELGDDFRLGALVQAGIEESQAREIKRRMDELIMESMNLQYEASQGGWIGTERFEEAVRELRARQQSFRESLDDDTYDRYLYATGRPNRIAVQAVLEGSPAERAGLRSGDLLLSYGGSRLFTQNELVERSRQGGGGETVTVEILRDGRRMQVYLPRGPLGIQTGFTRADPQAE